MPVKWETTRINAWHIAAIVVTLVGNAFMIGGIYVTMTSNDNEAVKSIASLQARVSGVEQKIPQFEVIGMQIQRLTELSAQNAKAIDAANDRMNRIVESQSGKLDTIIGRISDLASDVKVIQAEQKRTNSDKTRFPILQ